MKQKTALKLGVYLLFAGALILAVGYLTNYTPYESHENGYLYVDVIGTFGYILIFIGICILFSKWLIPKLKKISIEGGWHYE